MYLFPSEKIIGNLPVRSEYILSVAGEIAQMTRFERVGGICSDGQLNDICCSLVLYSVVTSFLGTVLVN